MHSNNGLRLLRQIVDGIRASVPPCFVVGIKLNASDYIGVSSNNCNPTSHPEETRALQHVLDIAGWGTVDFIDISGGDYENPGMPQMHIHRSLTHLAPQFRVHDNRHI